MGNLCNKKSQDPLLEEADLNKSISSSSHRINEKDFIPIKLIGKGSYGSVFLVRYKKNNTLYAMKVLSKSLLREQNQQNNTKSERDLMVQINCPFIVSVKFAFQNESKLFLVQEFLQGGDLYFHIHAERKFSSEKTKFYVIELVLAIEFLHKNNMLYRDLKPENILMGADGHIKITDFGLSKIISEEEKAYTICGTIQYLAPEILGGEGYDDSVDWWSLGCIMYEMLTGKFPFKYQKGKLNINIYKKKVKYPEYIEYNARDILSKFLETVPSKRLGSGENGWENVKNHPYFEGINWDDANNKKLKPPFIPTIENDTDIKYFENTFTDQPISENNDLNDDDKESEEIYQGFTYISNSLSEMKSLANEDEEI